MSLQQSCCLVFVDLQTYNFVGFCAIHSISHNLLPANKNIIMKHLLPLVLMSILYQKDLRMGIRIQFHSLTSILIN